jgi:hypothetical protein
LTSEIENLIDELPHASSQRVEEIVTILEGVLSEIECKFPIEDDNDGAYECQNIPKARDILVLVRTWNARDMELNETAGVSKVKREDGESETEVLDKLSMDLKIVFNQIRLVSIDPNE